MLIGSAGLKGQQVTAVVDTLKATSYMATFVSGARPGVKTWIAGLQAAPNLWVELFKSKKGAGISFHFPEKSAVMASGVNVTASKTALTYATTVHPDSAYRLMVSLAADSAGGFTLFSAYAFLPEPAKWKLIGCVKVTGYIPEMKMPGPFYSFPKRDTTKPKITDEWAQKANGSWHRMDGKKMAPPVVNLLSHADSLAGISRDEAIVEKAVGDKKMEPLQKEKGVYYRILNQGSGKAVSVSDSVKVFYKGYLFSDGSVFDQTKEEPRQFPLSRLITGWQIGVPLIKEGGKILLVIPPHLGYSIRTRSPKIPPNSILVFEIEVVQAK